jgi:hypothetical protein
VSPLPRTDSLRIERLISRTSAKGAAIILGVGEYTLNAARDGGPLLARTQAKIVDVLDIVDSWAS